jgi:hypothetical protein
MTRTQETSMTEHDLTILAVRRFLTSIASEIEDPKIRKKIYNFIELLGDDSKLNRRLVKEIKMISRVIS